jgi:fructuronate reductase
MLDFAGRLDPELARFLAADVAFPCTMVDSLTPATDDALRTRVAERLGVEDRWPVQREAFTQWVVEDDLRGPHPDWAALGVTVTDDVAAFERAKLRLLNGAHSTLAYMGSLAGCETVADAMRDASLAQFVRTLMIEDIAPSLRAPRGLDIARYIEAILQRFRNPALRHMLSQIAWDGSQKLPFRLLGTIREALAAGRRVERLCTPLAAWMQFIRRKASEGDRLVDPLAPQLLALGAACTGEPSHDVRLFLGLDAVFPPDLARSDEFVAAVTGAYGRLGSA